MAPGPHTRRILAPHPALTIRRSANDALRSSAALCREQGAELLLLHLPVGEALRDGDHEDRGEEYLRRLVERTGARGLDPRPRFLAASDRIDFSPGHYRTAGPALVARAVHAAIVELPSYRADGHGAE